VTDNELMALMHAELDGDLGTEQRAALARLLLSDPRVRALRDELRSLSNRLDVVGQVEPPPELKDSILRRLPSVPVARAYRRTSLSHWRLAAMLVGLLMAGAIVYETVQGPAPGSREIAGTIAADSLTAVDSVALGSGPMTGHATLYRDKSGLAVGLEVSAARPVDVFITTPGYSTRINGLGISSSTRNTRQMVALPGVRMQGQDIELSFLIDERTVSRATLHAPSGR
jgi:hypothetical protein